MSSSLNLDCPGSHHFTSQSDHTAHRVTKKSHVVKPPEIPRIVCILRQVEIFLE